VAASKANPGPADRARGLARARAWTEMMVTVTLQAAVAEHASLRLTAGSLSESSDDHDPLQCPRSCQIATSQSYYDTPGR
jgi:hypothetical protein